MTSTSQDSLYPDLPPDQGGCYYMTDGIRVKIGYTERPPRRRGGELHTELLLFIPGPPAIEEAELMRWDKIRIGKSEWVEFTMGLEAFLLRKMNPDHWDAQRAIDSLIDNHTPGWYN